MTKRSEGRKDPLTRIGQMPEVMPYKPCTRCFKGDTTRGIFVYGDRHFVAGVLVKYAEIDTKEAVETTKIMFEEMGTPYEERVSSFIRLCRGCARLTDAPVVTEAKIESGEPYKALVQSEEEE